MSQNFEPLVIKQFEDFSRHEAAILERMQKTPNGSHLFTLHPLLFFKDINVQLSSDATAALLKHQPSLRNLRPEAYQSLKQSSVKQDVHYRYKTLFR